MLDATAGPGARRPVLGATAGAAVRRRGRRRPRPAAHRLQPVRHPKVRSAIPTASPRSTTPSRCCDSAGPRRDRGRLQRHHAAGRRRDRHADRTRRPSWIVRYWIRQLGREPADDELEPAHPRCCGRPARNVSRGRLPPRHRGPAGVLARRRGVPHRLRPLAHTDAVGAAAPHRRHDGDSATNRCAGSPEAARRFATPASSPTSPATRRCRCRCGGTRTTFRSACISSAASATKRRCSAWRRNSRPPGRGPTAGLP